MRNLIFILLLSASFVASAQNVTADTVYFQTISGQLYQITRTEYDNGSYSETRYAADSLTVLRLYAANIERGATEIATAARLAVRIPQYFNESIRQQNMLNNAIGVKPVTAIQVKYEPFFLETASSTVWEFTTPASTQTVTFNKAANGALTVRIGSDAQRVVVLLGDMLRITHYPTTGQMVYLFNVNRNVWRSVDGDFELRRVNTARR